MEQLFTINESITLVLTTEQSINDFFQMLNENNPLGYEREYQRLNKLLNTMPYETYEDYLERCKVQDRLEELYHLTGRAEEAYQQLQRVRQQLEMLNPNSKEYVELWDFYSDIHKDYYGCRP